MLEWSAPMPEARMLHPYMHKCLRNLFSRPAVIEPLLGCVVVDEPLDDKRLPQRMCYWLLLPEGLTYLKRVGYETDAYFGGACGLWASVGVSVLHDNAVNTVFRRFGDIDRVGGYEPEDPGYEWRDATGRVWDGLSRENRAVCQEYARQLALDY